VEAPPSEVGKLEASRDSEGGLALGEITKELQNIKIPDFSRGNASEREEAWLKE
jgi:hypothetical protein